MAPFKVIIVGSGLAGNLLACGCINNGIEVEVYERLAKDAKREGYQIRLGENALKGFRACLTPAHKDKIVAKFGRTGGHFAAAPIVYDRDFKPLLDLNRFSSYEKSAVISRKILRDILVEPVEEAGRAFYDKSFDRYEVLNPGQTDEKIRVHFGDGTASDCDLLVAADGSHSKINKQIGLDSTVTLEETVSFLSKSSLPTESFKKMDRNLWAAPVGVSAATRMMYYCAYLPDKEKELRRPDEFDGSKKPGSALDDSISSCFFAYAIPTKECPADIKEWDNKEQWNLLADDMNSHWGPKYQQVVSLLRGSDLYIGQVRASHRPPRNWRRDMRSPTEPEKAHPRVLLIGDAIHAMLATRGMGGNQAMRDTASLLPFLVELNEKAGSGNLTAGAIEKACLDFEAEMIPRAFKWVSKSGGTKQLDIDTDTWKGWLLMKGIGMFLAFAAQFLWIGRLFTSKKFVEEAPELDG